MVRQNNDGHREASFGFSGNFRIVTAKSTEVTYDPEAIDPAHTYAIQARITVDGQPRFMTTTAYLVITQGNPPTIEVILEQVN